MPCRPMRWYWIVQMRRGGGGVEGRSVAADDAAGDDAGVAWVAVLPAQTGLSENCVAAPQRRACARSVTRDAGVSTRRTLSARR